MMSDTVVSVLTIMVLALIAWCVVLGGCGWVLEMAGWVTMLVGAWWLFTE